MSEHGHSGEGINDYKPPFEDAEGNLTVNVSISPVHASVGSGDDILLTHGKTTVTSTVKALHAFDEWVTKARLQQMDRVSINWDDGYFSASAELGPVKLCESFDSEQDYPGQDWPDPKYITLSAKGAVALGIWARLSLPTEGTG